MGAVLIVDVSEYQAEVWYKGEWYNETLSVMFESKTADGTILAVLDFMDGLKFRSCMDFLVQDIRAFARDFVAKIGDGTTPVFIDIPNSTIFSYVPNFFDVIIEVE